MSNLTVTVAGDLLDLLTGNGTYTPSTPLKLALVTVLGTASAAGTEVTGGSYARQTIAFGAQTGGEAANSATVTFADLPSGTVVGGAIYDNAGVRMLFGAFSNVITCNAGDDIVFEPGDLVLTAA